MIVGSQLGKRSIESCDCFSGSLVPLMKMEPFGYDDPLWFVMVPQSFGNFIK